jgi:hypothetical protein
MSDVTPPAPDTTTDPAAPPAPDTPTTDPAVPDAPAADAPLASVDSPAAEPAPASPDKFADWPVKGGNGEAQPWDLSAHGIDPRDEDAEVLVEVRVGLPLLTHGSQGPEVRELGQRLGELGYENSVTRGANPYGVYDDSVHAAVEGFRRDYDVAEDPSAFVRDPKAQSASHTGPWTQEAILRASDRAREDRAA